ncbi:MAG: hypothetical protein AAF702_40000 [Chloroflexota bacterium]
MERFVRTILIIGGLLLLGLALGFALGLPWLTRFWPNPVDTPLSYLFVASMQAAIAVAMLWIGITGGLHMIAAGSLNLAVMFGGMSVSLMRDETLLGEQTFIYVIGFALFALFNVVLIIWARQFVEPDPYPMPDILRWAYGIFVISLASVGALLISQTQEIMPWPLSPLTSALIGWMFFGDAFYFLYALIYPRWTNSAAQLWSFLAYDLVLIWPFLTRFADIITKRRLLNDDTLIVDGKLVTDPTLTTELKSITDPELIALAQRFATERHNVEWMFNSLTVYLVVLLFSFTLAIHYLFLHPDTGLWVRIRSRRE